jgi:hypothetical protein
MRVAIAVAVSFAASGLAVAGGSTVASLSSRPGPIDPTRDVKAWHNAQHTTCRFKRVLQVGPAAASEHGVESVWTVEACGRTFSYRVMIIGGSSVMVANADGSPAVRTKR